MNRDSTVIQDFYSHPDDGYGIFVMYHKSGVFHWCPSGNELRRVYLSCPEVWLTGPIFLSLSKEDKERMMKDFDDVCDNF